MVYKDLNFNISRFTIQSNNTHLHKKFDIKIENETTEIFLPDGELFLLSQNVDVNQSTIQVYINGALQSRIYHYQEIPDSNILTKGKGIDFTPNLLEINDIITLEWVEEL